jgi:hypothetical protein
MRSLTCLSLLVVIALGGCGGPSVELPTKEIKAPDRDPTEKIKAELPKEKQNQ